MSVTSASASASIAVPRYPAQIGVIVSGDGTRHWVEDPVDLGGFRCSRWPARYGVAGASVRQPISVQPMPAPGEPPPGVGALTGDSR